MVALRRLGIVVAVFWVFALSEMPAYAADGYQETVPGLPEAAAAGCDPDLGAQIRRTWGQACFFANGDDFWLVDKAGDGRSIAVNWRIPGTTRNGLIRDKLGVGVNSKLYKDFPESGTLKWRIGRCDETATNDCRQSSDYSNWGVNDSGSPEAYCTPIDGIGEGAPCSWP